MKVLSNFLLLILLDKKRAGNKTAFGEKASFKAVFLIFLLYNSFKDAFLLLLFHPLIVSSAFCYFAAESGISVFDKNNTGKGRRDDQRNTSTDIDRGIGVDNSSTKTGIDARIVIQV